MEDSAGVEVIGEDFGEDQDFMVVVVMDMEGAALVLFGLAGCVVFFHHQFLNQCTYVPHRFIQMLR